MLARQHLQFGIVATAGLLYLNPEAMNHCVPIIAGGVLGSLLPDIDSPDTKIGRHFLFISTILNSIFGHRTITHDFVFVLLLSAFFMTKNPFLIGLFIGIFSHLFLDSMTIKGIPISFLYKKNIHLLPEFMRFKSASNAAKFATFVSSILLIIGAVFVKRNMI